MTSTNCTPFYVSAPAGSLHNHAPQFSLPGGDHPTRHCRRLQGVNRQHGVEAAHAERRRVRHDARRRQLLLLQGMESARTKQDRALFDQQDPVLWHVTIYAVLVSRLNRYWSHSIPEVTCANEEASASARDAVRSQVVTECNFHSHAGFLHPTPRACGIPVLSLFLK